MEDRYLKFIFAIIAASLVLVVSLLFAQYLNNNQISTVSNNLNQVQQGLQELQVISSLGNLNSTVSCALIRSGMTSLSSQLSVLSLEAQADDFENQTGAQYSSLVDELSYARIEYWLLAQRIDYQCRYPFTTVLLFYRPQNCASCILQGNELSYLEQSDGNLSATSIDGQWNLSAISTLNQVYNLTPSEYPAMIINGKYVVKGYQTTAQILQDLCSYTNKTAFCNGTS